MRTSISWAIKSLLFFNVLLIMNTAHGSDAEETLRDDASEEEQVLTDAEQFELLLGACAARVSQDDFSAVLAKVKDHVINKAHLKDVNVGTFCALTRFREYRVSPLTQAFQEVACGGDPLKIKQLCLRGARVTRDQLHPLACLIDLNQSPHQDNLVRACTYLFEHGDLDPNEIATSRDGMVSHPLLFWAVESKNPKILSVVARRHNIDLAICIDEFVGKTNVFDYLLWQFSRCIIAPPKNAQLDDARSKTELTALRAKFVSDKNKQFYPDTEYPIQMLRELLSIRGNGRVTATCVLAESMLAKTIKDLAAMCSLIWESRELAACKRYIRRSEERAVRYIWLIRELCERGVNPMCPSIAQHDEEFVKCRDLVVPALVYCIRMKQDDRLSIKMKHDSKLQSEITSIMLLYTSRTNVSENNVSRLPFEMVFEIFEWLARD